MRDESVYQTNGRPESVTPTLTEADSLLLHQARQNVKDRKNLLKHIMAFIATWLVLFILYVDFIRRMVHPSWWQADMHINSLEAILTYIPEDSQGIIQSATWFMTSHFRHNYEPPIWYIIIGVMLAWGGWIAFCVLKRTIIFVSRKFQTSSRGKGKPDPVIQEYNRLKYMASDEMM